MAQVATVFSVYFCCSHHLLSPFTTAGHAPSWALLCPINSLRKEEYCSHFTARKEPDLLDTKACAYPELCTLSVHVYITQHHVRLPYDYDEYPFKRLCSIHWLGKLQFSDADYHHTFSLSEAFYCCQSAMHFS